MTKKLKTVNNSMEVSKPAKNVFDEYTDYNKIKKIITSNIYADKMAQEFIDMARANKETITMEEIYESFGILDQEFARLRKKYPILEEAYQYATQCIGSKRETQAARGKLNWNVLHPTQWLYSKKHKENLEYRALLSKREEEKPTNVTVVFPEHEMKQKEKL